MNILTHAALGYVVAGVPGAVLSVLPDVPLWIVHARYGKRQWLDREHPLMQFAQMTHSATPPLVYIGLTLAGHAQVTSVLWGVAWLLHGLTDYVTHPPARRWSLL